MLTVAASWAVRAAEPAVPCIWALAHLQGTLLDLSHLRTFNSHMHPRPRLRRGSAHARPEVCLVRPSGVKEPPSLSM